MINEEWDHEVESVSEQLILMMWISVGILAFIVPLLYLALGLG
jgi:hypothetical protein